VLILRNYGAICVGETIEETTYLAYLLVTACEQQVWGTSRELMVMHFCKVNMHLTIQVSKEIRCLHVGLAIVSIICPFKILAHPTHPRLLVNRPVHNTCRGTLSLTLFRCDMYSLVSPLAIYKWGCQEWSCKKWKEPFFWLIFP